MSHDRELINKYMKYVNRQHVTFPVYLHSDYKVLACFYGPNSYNMVPNLYKINRMKSPMCIQKHELIYRLPIQ